MAATSVTNRNNATLGNNNALTAAKSPESTPENLLTRIAATVYDVLVFLALCLKHIFQDLYFKVAGCPLKNLQGELALVTGGGSGLGRLTAMKLSKLGVDIIIWDINQEGIDETVEMVRATGGTCIGYKVDITEKESVYRAADVIRQSVGDVTVLINNAGVASGRALLDTPDHLIERTFNVNILAHFWTTKAFLPSMLEKDHGHIVTIASLAGHAGAAKLVDYCSSKFAAVGFDEALRVELESLGSNVDTTCICPFFITSTGLFSDVNAGWIPSLTSDSVADRVVSAIQRRDQIAIIPQFMQYMLPLKWLFPWGCAAELFRRIAPDASPSHDIQSGLPQAQRQLTKEILPQKQK